MRIPDVPNVCAQPRTCQSRSILPICSDASRTLHSITNEPVFATFIGADDSGSGGSIAKDPRDVLENVVELCLALAVPPGRCGPHR